MDGRGGITAELVRHLLAEQAPQWAGLPVVAVPQDGWDNRTYRLGDELTVRLPSHERYAAAVAKEDRWLPVLAPKLTLPIPEPVFAGRPSAAYPLPWSVRRWLPGRPASGPTVADPVRFAGDLAGFLRALWDVDGGGGPDAGAHSFFRGCPPSHYDGQTRRRVAELSETIDAAAALAVWDEALGSTWTGRPVWFHGDVALGNLLVDHGELAAVIDFGTCGVGDPACDLVIAWTFLGGDARRTFAELTDRDSGTWARARGWALWKALISVDDDPDTSAEPLRVIAEVLADPVLA